MSPTVEVRKKDLRQKQKSTLSRLSKMKRPAAVERPGKFLIVGGDNSAEAEISQVKGQLRRKNLLGRMSPKDTHVQQLAAKQLLENPGVMSVLKAFAEYRKDRQNHVGLKPGHCFNVQNDASWLP